MQRRDLLKGAFAGAAGLAVAGCGGNKYISDSGPTGATTVDQPLPAMAAGGGASHRWTLALFVPKDFEIWGPGVVRFADNVRALSGGRLDITVKGAGEVVPSLQIFNAVKDGDVEMGHAASYFWDGKAGEQLRASVYFTSVPFGMTANGGYAWIDHGGGLQLWEELYAPFNILPMPLGATGVQAGGWFRKPIQSLADLQGMTMRMPGLGGKVLTRAGGNAQTIPGHEIYMALERGRIDATEWVGPFHDYHRGFHEVAPYYYVGGWHEPGSILELSINKRKWDELDPALQHCVRVCAAEADRWIFAQWLAKDAEYYQKYLAMDSVTVQPYPAEIARALRPHADALKDEIAASSPIARKISESYAAFQQTWEVYQRANELSYLDAARLA